MRRILLLLIAFAWAFAAQASTNAWIASEEDFLLLNVELKQLLLAENVQGYRTPKGVCLILADAVQAFDFPIGVDERTGRAEGWFINERTRFRLDRHAGTVEFAGQVQRPTAVDWHDTPQGLCVDSDALARWWGMTLIPNLRDASIKAVSTTKLPVELAVERQLRQAKLRQSASPSETTLPRVDIPYALIRVPSVDIVASVEAIDDKRRGSHLDTRYELYASGELARLSADARLASDKNGVPATLRVRGYRKSPAGGLLGPLDATAAAVGDVGGYASSLVNQPRAGRGFFVTDQPIDRAQTFDRTDFRGELPQGWEAELYRNGQLLAFAEARPDGRYEFLDVPLLYGSNRFEVVLYGPQGQLRREGQSINVGAASIPSGETNYWFGVLQDNRDLITLRDSPRRVNGSPLRASAVVEHGIDTRTSVSLQAHTLEIDDDRLTYVEGAVRRSVGPAVVEASASATIDGASALQLVGIGRLGKTFVTGETLWARDFVSDRVEKNIVSRHRLDLEHYLEAGDLTVPIGIGLGYTDWRNKADELVVSNRISARFARTAVTHELRWQRFSSDAGPDPPDRFEGALLLNTDIGSLRLRGEGRYRLRPDQRFEQASVVGEWSSSERAEWRAEIAYERAFDRALFAVGHARLFDEMSVGVRAEAATDGSVNATFNLTMSFGPDTHGRFARMSHRKLAATGQAAARVFIDDNGNGVFDPGEKTQSNVGLSTGSNAFAKTTDADGEAILDGLSTFRPLRVAVDLSTIEDPYLQPATPGVLVTPRPGAMAHIDLPLVRTGEVDGTLKIDSGFGSARARGGVDLQLIDPTGKVVATARSEFDGFFLFTSVPYGRYEVRIEAATAARLRLPTGPIAAVDVAAGEPVANAGNVVVHSTPILASTLPEDEAVTAGTVLAAVDIAALDLAL